MNRILNLFENRKCPGQHLATPGRREGELVKQLFWIFVVLAMTACASTNPAPLGQWVEKQGELNLDKKSDPVEKWLDQY